MSDHTARNGNGNGNGNSRVPAAVSARDSLPAAWVAFINYCQQLQHGEVDKLKIQDGLPILAESSVKKIKFA